MSTSVSFTLGDGDTYTSFNPFWGSDGRAHVAVLYNPDDRGYAAIQGPPARLRELAAALNAAADEADQWAEANPPESEEQ